MKKLILMGRVAAGKTTLTQALKGEQLHYCKTQYINYIFHFLLFTTTIFKLFGSDTPLSDTIKSEKRSYILCSFMKKYEYD